MDIVINIGIVIKDTMRENTSRLFRSYRHKLVKILDGYIILLPLNDFLVIFYMILFCLDMWFSSEILILSRLQINVDAVC